MEFIKGITFAPFAPRGAFLKKEVYKSLDNLVERTGADFIILVPNGLQETPQSEDIDFASEATIGDEDVPCEPKWGNWFASYTKFQMHFAKLAKQANCEMFIAGCEMVQTERREGSRRFL